MSTKIESPTDAYNFVKEKCSNWVADAIEDPQTALPVVGIILAVILAIVILSVSLHNRRKMNQAMPLPKKRSSPSRRTTR